jgi:hypothetical protein
MREADVKRRNSVLNAMAHWSDRLPTRVRNALNCLVYDNSSGARRITDLDEPTVARMAKSCDPEFWRTLPNFGKHSQRALQEWLARLP